MYLNSSKTPISLCLFHRYTPEVGSGIDRESGKNCEEQDIFLTDQEHAGNADASSSNAGESEPSEWTCPGCGQIRTNAR